MHNFTCNTPSLYGMKICLFFHAWLATKILGILVWSGTKYMYTQICVSTNELMVNQTNKLHKVYLMKSILVVFESHTSICDHSNHWHLLLGDTVTIM